MEDAQYADAGLLDFLSHLIDWVRDLPVYVLVFARPELGQARPGFGAGRNRSTLTLDPLDAASMDRLVDALVPGMPSAARARITRQAQGIPLFAVETVRSLLDSYQPGHLAPMLRAERDLTRAWLAAGNGAPTAFTTAIAGLRELSTPYHLAHGLLDHGEYLLAAGDTEAAVAAIAEARAIAGRLRCRPLLDRAGALTPQDAPHAAS